jgi:lipoprotein-anchoring transpeptidase ErfK/SrfK
MRRRSLALAVLTLAVLVAGTGAVYAFDRSHRDRIAQGIQVNGVALGGMTPAQAQRALRARLLAPLDRPVRVRYEGERFKLTPRDAAIGLDVAGSVRKALARSRQGDMFSRTWRELRGGRVDAQLAAHVSYSRPAIKRLVERVHAAVDKPAVDAKVDLSTGQVDPRPSKEGVRVRGKQLASRVERQLLEPGARKPIAVRTKVVEPKVTTQQLAAKYPAVIVVNRGAFQLTLYKHLQPVKTYPIAVGQVGLETPAGLYDVQNKAVDPDWHVPNSAWAGDLAGQVIPGGSPENPIKARWLGIYDGAGIHGTSDDASIGSAASHGCIRMHIPDVEELYPQVPVGAPVYIG